MGRPVAPDKPVQTYEHSCRPLNYRALGYRLLLTSGMPRCVRDRVVPYNNKYYNSIPLPKHCRQMVFSYLNYMDLRRSKCVCRIQRAGKSESFALDAAEAERELLKGRVLLHVFVDVMRPDSHYGSTRISRVKNGQSAYDTVRGRFFCHHLITPRKEEIHNTARLSSFEWAKHQSFVQGGFDTCPLNVPYPGQRTGAEEDWVETQDEVVFSNILRTKVENPPSTACVLCGSSASLSDTFVVGVEAFGAASNPAKHRIISTLFSRPKLPPRVLFMRLVDQGIPPPVAGMLVCRANANLENVGAFLDTLRTHKLVFLCRLCLFRKNQDQIIDHIHGETVCKSLLNITRDCANYFLRYGTDKDHNPDIDTLTLINTLYNDTAYSTYF